MGRFEVRVCGARNIGDVQKVSLPDPYVKVRLGDDKKTQIKFKTRIIDNNLNPVWDELFKFQIADYDSQQVVFEVWNDNVVKDDILGVYRLSLNGLTRGVMQDVWVILTDTTLASAELHLRVLAIDFGLEPQPGQRVFGSIEEAEQANNAVVSDQRKKGKTGGPNVQLEVGGFAGQQQMQQQTVYGQPVQYQQQPQPVQYVQQQPHVQYFQQQPQMQYVQQQPQMQYFQQQPQMQYVQQPPQQPNVVFVPQQPPQPQLVYVPNQQPPPPLQQQYYQQGPPPPQPFYGSYPH